MREFIAYGYEPFGLRRETEKKISFDFFFKKGMRNKKGERERNGKKHWIFHRT